MSELDQRIEALTASVMHLAGEVKDTKGIGADRQQAIEAELTRQSTELDELMGERRQAELEAKVSALTSRLDDFRPASKAAAIMAGAGSAPATDRHFFSEVYKARRQNDPDSWAFLKATNGDTGANGQYIIPNNLVTEIIEVAKAKNPFRELMNVVPGLTGKAVDIPYEIDDSSIQKAVGQGGQALSFGSNKDNRNFTVGSATATLFTIARIIDVGNQFLRQSNGAAERLVRSKLGRAFGLAEADYIINGAGTNSSPKGISTSITAAYTTTLSSESRIAAVGRAIGALEGRAYTATAVVVHPTDFWELATETLGSSGSGGWAFQPAAGAGSAAITNSVLYAWGIPVVRDPNQTVGTGYVAPWKDIDLYFGQDYRVDVSSEANTRFDLNLTGFRGEEEMAFNADPYVLTGMVQKVTGI